MEEKQMENKQWEKGDQQIELLRARETYSGHGHSENVCF